VVIEVFNWRGMSIEKRGERPEGEGGLKLGAEKRRLLEHMA
jgi:hypothetical protein